MSQQPQPSTVAPRSSYPFTLHPNRMTLSPAISKIITQIQNRQQGRAITKRIIKGLHPKNYRQLIDHVLKPGTEIGSFFAQKIRYDYLPDSSQFIFRTISPLHRWVAKEIRASIKQQLRHIGESDEPGAELARMVISTRSAAVALRTSYGNTIRRCPDISFYFGVSRFPSVIVEFADHHKDLRQIADEYIIRSLGSVQAVIGIDIPYQKGKSKEILVSVWHGKQIDDDEEEYDDDGYTSQWLQSIPLMENQIFRTSTGDPVDDAAIVLPLEDFISTGLWTYDTGPDQRTVHITSNQLCWFLEVAEEGAKMTGTDGS